MKKLFATFLTLIIVVISVAGCGGAPDNSGSSNNGGSTNAPQYTTAKDGEWVEVASIKCNDVDLNELSSTVALDYDRQWITEEEYDAIPTDQKDNLPKILYGLKYSYKFEIGTDRITALNELQGSINKTYTYTHWNGFSDTSYLYAKITILAYKIRYVKLRFMGDESLEISYFSTTDDNGNDIFTTVRVKPSSYKITYFNN